MLQYHALQFLFIIKNACKNSLFVFPVIIIFCNLFYYYKKLIIICIHFLSMSFA